MTFRWTLDAAKPGWPVGLDDLDDPPERLWVEGRLPAAGAPVAAVVGTRQADDDALAFAYRLGTELSADGVVVLSGGARGVDAAAHQGAVDAGGAPTVAVAAMGLDQPPGRTQATLFEAILDAGGAVVTELPPEVPAEPFRFLERNRLVAAWAGATVVVQAPVRSGALSTARVARELGRPVLAVPAAPWDVRGGGVLGLLHRGHGRVCGGADDVLAALGMAPARRAPGTSDDPVAAAPRAPSDPDARRLLSALSSRPRHPDELARATGLAVDRIHRALLLLLLDGAVVERAGGRWARTPG